MTYTTQFSYYFFSNFFFKFKSPKYFSSEISLKGLTTLQVVHIFCLFMSQFYWHCNNQGYFRWTFYITVLGSTL